MAMNIPLPSADFGGTLPNMMEKLLQQRLGQQTENRNQALHPYQMQKLQAEALEHQAKANDMMYYQNLIQQFMGNGQPQQYYNPLETGQNPNIGGLPDMGGPQPMGGGTPAGGLGNMAGGAPNWEPQAQQGQSRQPFNFTQIPPFLAGIIEKKTGGNPLAESPEQKRQAKRREHAWEKTFDKAADRTEHVWKTNFDETFKQSIPLNIPTKESINAAQNVVIAGNNIIPLVNDYLAEEITGAWTGSFSPTQKALVDAMAGLSTDEVMTILGLSKDKHSTEIAEGLFTRKPGENEEGFKSRVTYVLNRMDHKIGQANNLLQGERISYKEKPDLSRLEFWGEIKDASGKMTKIKVKNQDKEAFKKAGGKLVDGH